MSTPKAPAELNCHQSFGLVPLIAVCLGCCCQWMAPPANPYSNANLLNCMVYPMHG